MVALMSSHAAQRPDGEALVPDGRWEVDPRRSSVRFEVRHFRVSRVRGRFGSFACRLEAGDRLRIDGSVDAATIETGDPVRDERLRADEFLNSAAHPGIDFTADRAVPDGGSWRIEGELTIRGVTRPLALRASRAERADGAVGIAAGGALSRRDFGLEWDALVEAGRLVVSDRVDIAVDVALVPAPAR